MRAVGGRGTSWRWKGILQGRKILEASMRWRIGSGQQVRICLDKWVPKPSTFKIYSRHPDMPILVQGLIEDQTKMWNRDLILCCFNSVEAQTILSLPLSRWGCDDKLVWHFTAHGGYSVRTGYELALNLPKNGELGGKAEGECSHGNDQKNFWNSIWRLQLDASQLIGEEFIECWDSILKKYEKHVNSQEIRNSAVFEGTITDPTTMVGSLQAQVQEYRAAQMSAKPLINELPRRPDHAQSVPNSWTKPTHGWVKANCDGAWLQQTQRGGAGWVIRDTDGWLVQAGV
ncbi:unnamed protein product [Prunus armeniaca]